MIPENGVEDSEKLPHHGNEGDLLGSATGSELGRRRPGKGNGRCVAVRAAMYSTARTDVRPPAMALRPRIRPESRLIGATPTRAATWMAADSPEFGQFSEKSPCGHVADARNGFQ